MLIFNPSSARYLYTNRIPWFQADGTLKNLVAIQFTIYQKDNHEGTRFCKRKEARFQTIFKLNGVFVQCLLPVWPIRSVDNNHVWFLYGSMWFDGNCILYAVEPLARISWEPHYQPAAARPRFFNILMSRQNGLDFADDIFKCIFLNENLWILSKISMKYVP